VVTTAIATDSNLRNQEDWAFERRILPHLSLCYNYISTTFADEGVADAALAISIYILATTEKVWGQFSRAEYLYKKAIICFEMVSDTLGKYIAMSNLADCLCSQGEYDEALRFAREAKAGMENLRGPEDEYLLNTMRLLGMVLGNTGNFEESLQTHERVYAWKMKVLGPNNISTVTTIHDIGLVYGRKGDFGKAQEWVDRSVEGMERLVGPEHPNFLNFRHNKAVVLERGGCLHEAWTTYSQVLIGCENSLGKDHPMTKKAALGVRGLVQQLRRTGGSDRPFSTKTTLPVTRTGRGNEKLRSPVKS
jgi:hypothetical protein